MHLGDQLLHRSRSASLSLLEAIGILWSSLGSKHAFRIGQELFLRGKMSKLGSLRNN